MTRSFVFLFALAAWSSGQNAARIDREHLMNGLRAIQSSAPDIRPPLEKQFVDRIRQNRLDFPVTSEVIQAMKRAGASEEMIQVARECGLTFVEMLNKVRVDLESKRFPEAVAGAEKAAAIEPSPAAWELVAKAKGGAGDTPGARAAYLEELAAGGEVAIPVGVAPPGENFRTHCDGILTVSRKRIAVIAPPPCRVALDMSDGQLIEAKRNQFVGVQYQAFHISVQTEQGGFQTLNLMPTDQDAQALDWILRAFQFFHKP